MILAGCFVWIYALVLLLIRKFHMSNHIGKFTLALQKSIYAFSVLQLICLFLHLLCPADWYYSQSELPAQWPSGNVLATETSNQREIVSRWHRCDSLQNRFETSDRCCAVVFSFTRKPYFTPTTTFLLKVCFNALNHNFQYNVRSPFCKTCPAKLCTLWLHCVVAASTAETSTADKYYKMITGWKKKRKK